MSPGRYLACATLVFGFGVLASTAQAEDKITIGFVTHSQGDPFIQQIIDGAQAAADDLGVTLKVAQQQGSAPDLINLLLS
jgi:ABC-type sugar transport system substrate-binding protein